MLTGAIERELKRLLGAKASELGCEIVALEVMPDHVHLFLNCPPTIAPDQLMFRLKGFTAHELRRKHLVLQRMPSMWTRSYFCSTAGTVSSATIKRYIAEQKAR